MLKDCFDNTDWELFAEGTDLKEYVLGQSVDTLIFAKTT